MKKETIIEKVLGHINDAVLDRDDGERLWFKVTLLSRWSFSKMRLPYWQVMGCDLRFFYLIVFYK